MQKPRPKRWPSKNKRARVRIDSLILTPEQTVITCAVLVQRKLSFRAAPVHRETTFEVSCTQGFDQLTSAYEKAVTALQNELLGIDLKEL